MQNRFIFTGLLVCLAISGAFASDSNNSGSSTPDASANAAVASAATKSEKGTDSRGIGIGFRTSLLGLGGDVAVPVTHRSNVRVGFSAFNYSHTFDKDGVSYSGKLGLSSVQALYDFFPFAGGFHLSPGVLLYNGNQLSANASVPGGQSFSLGGTNYFSDPSNPLTGSGKLHFGTAGPMFLLGFGNLARRSERHFGMTVDIGAVYQEVPRTTLNLAGGACDSTGLNCRNVASDSTIQSNILSEQAKINHSVSLLRFYPVISLGFGYKF